MKLSTLFKYNRKRLIISIVLFVLAILILFPVMLNLIKSVADSGETPDRIFGYGIKELEDIRKSYGSEGAKMYFMTRFTLDIIWPCIYVFFMVNVLVFLLDGLKGKWVLAIKMLPFIAVIFDLFENIFCSIYFFSGQKTVGLIASFSSLIKWHLLMLIFLLFILLGLFKFYRYIRSRKK